MKAANDMVWGPRGRNFLMNLVVAFDDGSIEGSGLRPLEHALWWLDREAEYNTRRRGIAPQYTVLARAKKVAPLLEQVPLTELTPKLMYDALDSTVTNAAYWQPLTNTDLLLATRPVRPGLRRIASHLQRSPLLESWAEQFRPGGQSSVSWKATGSNHRSVHEVLNTWRMKEMNPSLWWSTPPQTLIRTSGKLEDGIPGSLRFVEDGFGWNTGQIRQATILLEAQVFTINGPDDWAFLCRRFPLDLPMSNAPNWTMTTGYPHKWVIPDYVQVAKHYDGVHLSIQGYLATAGRAVVIDGNRAGILAGWDPGQTYWLTDVVELGEPVTWRNHSQTQEEKDWRPLKMH